MTNLNKLYKLRLFALDDIATTMQISKAGASSSLLRWQEQGIVKMIRRNLYTVTDPATDAPLVSKYEVASNISSTSYVGWHTALEFHGLAHQPFNNAYVGSESRFNNFNFDGVSFEYVHAPLAEKEDTGIEKSFGNPYVKVTNLERTIVDCCDKIDRAGGIEELLHCMESVTLLDEMKILKYLDLYGKSFLYQKIGFVLEQSKEHTNISSAFIDLCRKKGAIYTKRLTNNEDSDTFVKEWYLYVPHDILTNSGAHA